MRQPITIEVVRTAAGEHMLAAFDAAGRALTAPASGERVEVLATVDWDLGEGTEVGPGHPVAQEAQEARLRHL